MSRCVIFDLDGTLANTSGDLIAAANACFEGMGEDVRLDPQQDGGVALHGARRMLTEGLTRAGRFSQDRVEEWFPKFLQLYANDIDRCTYMYPGAVDSVRGLRQAGYAVGVCTNKPEALAVDLLARLGVSELFDSLVGADTLTTRKPDVAPYWAAVDGCGGTRDLSLLVGDSTTDRRTAAAANVPCILVTFPPGAEDVHALAPDAVIDHFDELAGAVARLIG